MGMWPSRAVRYGPRMSEAARRVSATMNMADFLAWATPGNGRWQLIDGQPQAMAPASETHNILQGELGALNRNHLVAMGRRCMLDPNAGIGPHLGKICSQ